MFRYLKKEKKGVMDGSLICEMFQTMVVEIYNKFGNVSPIAYE